MSKPFPQYILLGWFLKREDGPTMKSRCFSYIAEDGRKFVPIIDSYKPISKFIKL